MEVCIMIIEWYNNTDNSKKLNKSPTFIASGTCNIFGSCNMDNPNFIVDDVKGNYVKFDNTYYFVDSKSYVGGKWVIHCSVDALYSNINGIKAMNVNVIRNEYAKDDYIVDSCLPVKADRLTVAYPVGNEIISKNETSYIIGVI